MPRYEDPKYKDIESIMIRLEPISKCIDYLMETVPKQDKLYQKSIDKHRKIREIGLKMFEYSDSILKTYDKDYVPSESTNLSTKHSEKVVQTRSNTYNANNASAIRKEIMRGYHTTTRFASLDKYDGDTVMQSIAKTFYVWFYERYNSSSISNTADLLPYSCDVIIQYIDKFIIGAGYYLCHDELNLFNRKVLEWTTSRQKGETRDSFPSEIYDICTQLPDNLTPQAIFIEDKLKSIIFNDNFLPENRSTIKHLAMCLGVPEVVTEGAAITSLTK